MSRTIGIAALLLLVLGYVGLCDHEFTTSAIRASSPLHATIDRYSPNSKIRDAILTLIPIGTPRSTVEAEIKTHFSGSPRQAADLPDTFLDGYRGAPQVCIRIFDHHDIPAGGDWVEAVFVFDDASRLKELIIGKYGVYM